MRAGPLLLLLVVISANAFADDWFCRPNIYSSPRPIQSVDCATMQEGPAFCRKTDGSIIRPCGQFSTTTGRINVFPDSIDGKSVTIDLGPAPAIPETYTIEKSWNEATSPEGLNELPLIRSTPPPRRGSGQGFPPRVAKFSASANTVAEYTNAEWLRKPRLDQAYYLHDLIVDIQKRHGFNYSPRILLCKAYHESCFRPQVANEVSTAAGLSAVTKATLKDIFNRGDWFRSQTPGYGNITTGEEYHARMAESMELQLEAGIAVFHQKDLDTNLKHTENSPELLKLYLGNPTKMQEDETDDQRAAREANIKKNKDYADAIFMCAREIVRATKKSGGKVTITMESLKLARSSCE